MGHRSLWRVRMFGAERQFMMVRISFKDEIPLLQHLDTQEYHKDCEKNKKA